MSIRPYLITWIMFIIIISIYFKRRYGDTQAVVKERCTYVNEDITIHYPMRVNGELVTWPNDMLNCTEWQVDSSDK